MQVYHPFLRDDPTMHSPRRGLLFPISALQVEDVVYVLFSIGLEPKEAVLMQSGYILYALVEVNGKKVAIEVDGAYHFIGDC
jgi:hypothetical protein